MGKKQKTTSVPDLVDQWLDRFLQRYAQPLAKFGITTKPKLYEVLAKHGEEPLLRKILLEELEKSKDQATLKPT